jgi:hypothetical protein
MAPATEKSYGEAGVLLATDYGGPKYFHKPVDGFMPVIADFSNFSYKECYATGAVSLEMELGRRRRSPRLLCDM